MSSAVALLRGINVGTAKRISMADLRAVFEEAGASDVRTHLQSGNVVFSGSVDAAALEAAVKHRTGVSSRILLIPGKEFRTIAAKNPLREVTSDLSKGVIIFLEKMPASIDRPTDEELAPERLAFGTRAVYQWLPDGTLKTKLPPAFYRSLGLSTARNLRTVDRLVEMLDE